MGFRQFRRDYSCRRFEIHFLYICIVDNQIVCGAIRSELIISPCSRICTHTHTHIHIYNTHTHIYTRTVYYKTRPRGWKEVVDSLKRVHSCARGRQMATCRYGSRRLHVCICIYACTHYAAQGLKPP